MTTALLNGDLVAIATGFPPGAISVFLVSEPYYPGAVRVRFHPGAAQHIIISFGVIPSHAIPIYLENPEALPPDVHQLLGI